MATRLWISPARLARHEFYRAARSLRLSYSAEEIFSMLSTQKKDRITSFSKQFSTMILVYIILTLSQFDDLVVIKTSFFEFSMPKLYLVFLVAAMVFISIMEFYSYMVLNEYQRVVCDRFIKFDNASVRTVLIESGSAWSYPFNNQYRFLKHSRFYAAMLGSTITVLMAPIFAIYLMVYLYELSYIYKYLIGYNFLYFGDLLALISFVLLVFPILFVSFSFTPFPFTKNVSYIRWNFLTKVYKPSRQFPPRSHRWH